MKKIPPDAANHAFMQARRYSALKQSSATAGQAEQHVAAPGNKDTVEPVNDKPLLKSPISPREAECVSWAAIGKTATEIADILSISEHTVNFHTSNAIKKLQCANKTHAVAKAIVCGYIKVTF